MPDTGTTTHPKGSRRRGWTLFSLAVLAIVLVLPLVWPVPELSDTVPPARLADPDSRFIDVGEIEFHYKESGDPGATCNVVLLHGFGASVFSWRDTLPSLGDRCRVIGFDRPAFGLTGRPMPGEWTGSNPYSVEEQAAQTVALMDRLGMRRAVLVGHSAGAAVAVLVARDHPDRVSGLVLEAPAVLSGGGPPSWVTPLLRSPQARRVGPLFVRRIAGPGSDEFIRSAYADPDLVTESLLAGYRRPLGARNWDRALWEYTAAPRRMDAEATLGALTMPVLVVYGQEDAIVAPNDSRTVAASIPGAEVVALPDVGHIPHEELPAAFETLVFRFLDDLEAAGIP